MWTQTFFLIITSFQLNYAPVVTDTFNATKPQYARTLIRKATHNDTSTIGDIKYTAWLFDHRSYKGAVDMFSSVGKDFELSCKGLWLSWKQVDLKIFRTIERREIVGAVEERKF